MAMGHDRLDLIFTGDWNKPIWQNTWEGRIGFQKFLTENGDWQLRWSKIWTNTWTFRQNLYF